MEQPGGNRVVFGLSPNVAAALSYVLGWITGLILYLSERDNRFVRFHALQSIVVFGALTILNILASLVGALLGGLPLLGPLIWVVVGLIFALVPIVMLVAWIVLIILVLQGRDPRLPFVVPYVERYL